MYVEIDDDHSKAKDCQLIIALSGSPLFIMEQLEKMVMKMSFDLRHEQGKPCQGTSIMSESIESIVTPIWNGKKY